MVDEQCVALHLLWINSFALRPSSVGNPVRRSVERLFLTS